MENFLIINDTVRNRISYYHLLTFVVLLPYDLVYSELVLISLIIHTAIQFRISILQTAKIRFLFPVIIYLLSVGGLIYSLDIQQANMDLEKQLAILLFPLIMLFNDIDYSKYIYRLLLAFAFSCIVAIIYLFIDAMRIIEYYNLPFKSLFTPSFTNHNFSSAIGLHATYFSMYIALSLAIILYFLLRSRNWQQRFILIICLLTLIAGLFQLQSRATFVTALLIVNLLFPLVMLKAVARKRYIAISIIFSVIVISILVSIDSFKYRYITDFRKDLTVNRTIENPPETRMARWLQAWQLIKKSPVVGFGSGSEGKILRQKYFNSHFFCFICS